MENSLVSRPDAVTVASVAELPSRFGEFRFVAFRGVGGEELGAVVRGDVRGAEGLPVRLHSACFTGDLMGSLRCDCREQLEAALAFVGERDAGAVLYLPQEGRGIGLVNKIRAYALQEQGLDTVEANHALGFGDDLRDYQVAADMLKALGVASIRLLTNNPSKVLGVQRYGIEVDGTIPLRIDPNPHNEGYLATKRDKSGHLL